MATRIFACGPADKLENVQENVGPTATSAIVALVIDLSASVTGQAGVARTVSKSEVLQAMEVLEEWIVRQKWPPA